MKRVKKSGAQRVNHSEKTVLKVLKWCFPSRAVGMVSDNITCITINRASPACVIIKTNDL